MKRRSFPCAAALALLVASGARDVRADEDDAPIAETDAPPAEDDGAYLPGPETLDLPFPLLAEGGPLIVAARPVAPLTYAFAQIALAGSSWSQGRAEYTEVVGRIVAGGAWSPSFFPRLELGGDLVLLQGHGQHTVVPPAIDEWTTPFDLGELRVHLSFLAWDHEPDGSSISAGVRPHVRLTLPTDTSRFRETRRAAPLRRVLGDGIAEHEFVLTDLGVSAAFRWTVLSVYQTVGFVFGAVIDSDLEFLFGSTTGIAVTTGALGLEFVVELNVLLSTAAPPGGDLQAAVAVSPGIRYRTGDLWLGLESRVGLTPDAVAPYGDATVGFSARYGF
jgi:hypothetical protein